ncbi:MAG: hypothetical protein ACHP7N_02195 [Caulobacterales bacterium]
MPTIAPPFIEVCAKGRYGPPDQCMRLDIVSGVLRQASVLADEHVGATVAIAAAVLAAFAFALWRSTEKLWEQSRDTLVGASLGERAWVTFGASHQAFNLTDNNVRQLAVGAIWQNFGRTPARHVRQVIYREQLGRPVAEPEAPETVIGPGGGARTAAIYIPFDDFVGRQQQRCVIISEVSYNDIFSRTERRSLIVLEVSFVGAFDLRKADIGDQRLATAFTITSKRHTAT